MTNARKIALVLGAGGTVGLAYHAGVLAALDEAGWDARDADVVVGTSAGSLAAAILRAGISGSDLAADGLGRAMSPEGALRSAGMSLKGRLPLPGLHQFDFRRGPASPAMLLQAVLKPGRMRAGALGAAFLPAGTVSTAMIETGFNQLHPAGWPARPTWICAVRLTDGRLVAFGRPRSPIATVGAAVAASCAIPAYFAPVKIGGARYVDGGAHSVTNADLCAGQGYDLVVVVVPMAATRTGLGLSVDTPIRYSVRARLGRELDKIRRAGSQVLTFMPTAEDRAAMGPNAMDPRRRRATTVQARESALRRLDDPSVRERLALLTSAA